MRWLVLSVVCIASLTASAAPATAAPTRAEFIRRGDAVCAATAREIAPLRRRAVAAKALPEAKKWAAGAAIWRDQAGIQVRFNARMRAIGVPRGDAVARSLIASLDRGVALARRVADAYASRRTSALETALIRYVRFTVALNGRVRSYGFEICGRS